MSESNGNPLLTFETVIHAAPRSLVSMPETWNDYETIQVDPTSLTEPFQVNFDQVGEAASAIDRMFFEPDGYFVWSGDTAEGKRWQVDGVVYDRNDRLFYVEMRGSCPTFEFMKLLTLLGSPPGELIFQLPRAAVYLNRENFVRYAASNLADGK